MKKGFTLIELLAVIVVLAIISVIAIPTLIGVVNKAKLNALKSSAYGLIEASNLYYAQYANSNNARFDINNNIITTTEQNKIKYKGNIKQGTVIISKRGEVTVCITDGVNSAYKNYNDTEVSLVSKKTCTIPASTSIVYLNGEATRTELSNQELTDKVNQLSEELNTKYDTLVNMIASSKLKSSDFVSESYAVNGNSITKTKAGYYPISGYVYCNGTYNCVLDAWKPSYGSITFRAIAYDYSKSQVTVVWAKMDE